MVYVMSDIHGNWERYCSIMRKIKLQPEDHLYVLGDIVDRYPQGLKILWQLILSRIRHYFCSIHRSHAKPKQLHPSSCDQVSISSG